jgi:hypothetical protein
MTQTLEMPDLALVSNAEVAFYGATETMTTERACAAMMIGAMLKDKFPGFSPEAPGVDNEFLAQFTGVPILRSDQRTTGMRTMQSFSDHGLSVNVISSIDYPGFARADPNVSPPALGNLMERVRESAHDEDMRILMGERCTTGSLVSKFAEREAYENPYARKAYEQRPAHLRDAKALMTAGWLVRLNVDGRYFATQKSVAESDTYIPLPLVVTALGKKSLRAHVTGGNGVKPQPDRRIMYEELAEPWAASGNTLLAVGRIRQKGSEPVPNDTQAKPRSDTVAA